MLQRVIGFDVVKGAAIILVVFGHVWRGLFADGILNDGALFARIDDAIYLFHMPVFFFLAGLFLSTRPTPWPFLKSRIVHLLWPLVLWSIVDGAAKVAVGGPLTLRQVLIPWEPTTGIFWFLWALFFLSLLAYALSRFPLPVRLGLMAALALAAMAGWIGAGPYQSLWPVFIHMPEFFAGVALGVFGGQNRLTGPRRALPGLALFVVGQAVLAFGLTDGDVAWRAIAMALAALGFILCLANLSMPSPFRDGLIALGRLTMPIYLTHILFTAGTRMAMSGLGVDDPAIHLGIGTIIGIVGPVALCLAARWMGLALLLGFDRPSSRGKPPTGAITPT